MAYRTHMRAAHGVYYELSEGTTRVAELRAHHPDTDALEHLRPYQALAIARHEVYGESWEQVAQGMGKSAGHLSKAASSPAGREFREQLSDIMGDAKSVVKTLMESASLQMYVDWMLALEWAKNARDYKAIHTMMKDVGLQPTLLDAQRDAGPQTMIINVMGGTTDTLEVPRGRTSFEVATGAGAPAHDAEWELDDDDEA